MEMENKELTVDVEGGMTPQEFVRKFGGPGPHVVVLANVHMFVNDFSIRMNGEVVLYHGEHVVARTNVEFVREVHPL